MSERQNFTKIAAPKLEFVIDKFPDFGEGGVEDSYLTNGKHNIIKCSMCNVSLCDIWVTQPDAKASCDIVVHCCMCGDKSFETKIVGRFHLGIVSEKIHIIDVNMSGDKVVIKTGKN